jgi:hypothetical protein
VAALKEYITIVAKKRATSDKHWQAFHDEATKSLK